MAHGRKKIEIRKSIRKISNKTNPVTSIKIPNFVQTNFVLVISSTNELMIQSTNELIMNKVVSNADEAIRDIENGATLNVRRLWFMWLA
jgi:hypothetical protein